MKYILITVISLTFINGLFSQDSLKLESQLSINIQGQHILAALAKKPIECITCPRLFVTDNPFHHFAIYSGIDYKGILNEKHSFETGLYLEERSFSGGNNTIDNWLIFPKIKISSSDTLKIGGHSFQYQALAGDFWDEEFDDILRFYNIDFHGLKVKLGWNKFRLGFYVIGDLSRNIGFDLHEMYKATFEYRNDRFINVTSLSQNELFSAPRGNHPENQDFNFANYSKIHFSKNITAESQIEVRLNKTDKASMALGGKVSYNKEDLVIVSGVRYFQANFNKAYKSFKPIYRFGKKYIGNQLYPLKNFYRPINQWALFTNYQNSDLFNWEFRVNWKKNLFRKLYFTSEIDFNLIYNFDEKDIDYYPFYNIGFNVNFLNNFVMSITGTNKHMNLDTYFQTAYASKRPFLSYGFKMNLNNIRLRTLYL